MTQQLAVDGGTIAYDLVGEGPLVVLAHGMGDSRRSYRFVVPALVEAGYQVANVDLRGCGESTPTWDSYSRTDIAGDLLAVIRHIGGPAVIIGQSISGGAATIAAATDPELVAGVVELAPFTRKQSMDVVGLLRNRTHRAATLQLAKVMMGGSLAGWLRYLDLAFPTKPADWAAELARSEAALSQSERMAALTGMTKTTPVDAGRCLPAVRQPVLVIEGSADPDWADPRAEGERIIGDLPDGVGELAVIEGAGHYPHTQTPAEVLALVVPFLCRTLLPVDGAGDGAGDGASDGAADGASDGAADGVAGA